MFERFLAPERGEPPDIDIDIESDRREEVIQYVYEMHGREHAAQVANVITYRPKSAVRDIARALGYSHGQQDAWSKEIEQGYYWSSEVEDDISGDPATGRRAGGRTAEFTAAPGDPLRRDGHVRPSGHRGLPGRVGTDAGTHRAAVGQGRLRRDRPGQVRPARAGHALGDPVLLRADPRLHGITYDLDAIPKESPCVYDMLCEADSIGVFQVESRAQMATLPRLKPRNFYDLAIEVALIRPGPIQGGSVHPYIRRKNGDEPITYPHPRLEEPLRAHARHPAVPGTADAARRARRRLHARPRPTNCGARWARSGRRTRSMRCGSASTTG